MIPASPIKSAEIFFLEKEAWLAGQREALAAALNEAPLAESLGILARTASAQLGPGVRAAFYLANSDGTALHHVVGMTAAYAKAVDGFPIGPESLSCGLAVHTGQPILTADVTAEPLWADWRWLAAETGFRGSWSFPIHAIVRKFVGTLAIYWPQPTEATSRHCELAAMLTQAAGIIIARHVDSETRKRIEQALRDSQTRLQSELVERQHAETIMRQRAERVELLSEALAQLLAADDSDSIVRQLLPKVARHLGVDTWFYYMVHDSTGALTLHSYAGIPEEAAHAIERLESGEGICGMVARTRAPIHATDIQHSADENVALMRTFGIQCCACNPLIAGDRLLGTLSFASRSCPAFNEDELQFVRNVAQHTAVALDRLQSARRLQESEERFRMLADNMDQLAWVCDNFGEAKWYNQRWLDYTGLSFEEMKDWGWKQVHHPDHVDRVLAGVMRSREIGEPWEDTFPLRSQSGEYRWFLSRAVPIRNAAGEIVRWFGTNTDITGHKHAEETRKLLLNELNHRVKNTLAIVQAIAQRTSARTRDPAEFAKRFGGRIQSLARVHALLSDASWHGADLHELIRDQLLTGSMDESRLTAEGPTVRLDAQMALHLALILHELGTNSSKYGALAADGGWVTVSWTTDDALHLRWIERGGPPVVAPSKRGFGTTLIEQSAKGQGGDARMHCEADGITWDITLPLRGQTGFSIAPKISSATEFSPGAVVTRKEPSLSKKRFLVVEDEPLISLDIAAALEEADATVEGPVSTPEMALEIIERTSLDGALLDANLYGRPVDDIASALTRHNVPFIFLTGHGRSGLPVSFREVGIVSKPFSRERVIEAAAQLVTKKPGVVQLTRDRLSRQ